MDLSAGATLTYQVAATVSGSASGTLQNTATVTAPTGVVDTLPSNNSASDIDSVTPQFDLSVTKTNNQSSVIAGETTTYTILIQNLGPSDVTDAVVTDTFSSAFTDVTYTSVASGGATGNTANGAGNINDAVNLPAGASITYTASATVSSLATDSVTNTASISAESEDEDNLDNNTAVDTDPVEHRADLAITKTDNQSTVNPGSTLTYQVQVGNDGPSDVFGASVVDTIPASLTNVTYTSSASGGASGNTNGSGNLNDAVNLPAGSSITYQISATVSAAASGTIANTATVTTPAGITDPNNANNSATDSTTIEQVLRSISGYVYVDVNGNGEFESGEPPLRDVALSLSGTDVAGSSVAQDTVSAANGLYEFADLSPGSYQVTETQPPLFGDGSETIGTGSLTPVQATDNVFANIGLGSDQDAIDFNFGEDRSTLSKRDLLASRFA